jgi:multiple sugar transport system permease protein
MILQLAPGLGVALLLNAGSRVVEAVRTAFILPMVLPAIVVAVVWKVILDTALAAIAVADTWEWFPFTMLMVLAALQMIPGEPIDAAGSTAPAGSHCSAIFSCPISARRSS